MVSVLLQEPKERGQSEVCDIAMCRITATQSCPCIGSLSRLELCSQHDNVNKVQTARPAAESSVLVAVPFSLALRCVRYVALVRCELERIALLNPCLMNWKSGLMLQRLQSYQPRSREG